VDVPRINFISNRQIDPSKESSQDRRQKEQKQKTPMNLSENANASLPKTLNPSKHNSSQVETLEESQSDINRQIIDTKKLIDLLAQKPKPIPPTKHSSGVKFPTPKTPTPNKKEKKINKSI